MSRTPWTVSGVAWLALAVSGSLGHPGPARGDEPPGRDIPAAWAPLEYLVGRWNGQARPRDNAAQRFRGWPESHSWAWVFTQGKPTGLSVTITGGKVLAHAKLTYDPAGKRYRLEGTGPRPGSEPIVFQGGWLDGAGKMLVLDQVGLEGRSTQQRGTWRLSLWPNANFVRYTLRVDRREAGAIQFSPTIEIGLTREGETLAASSSSTDRPKCIVTGGAATMTLTYQGRTFPICCTGCRDEFHDNPEKYLQKAARILRAQAETKSGQAVPSRVSRFDDAFAGDVVDSPAMKAQPTAPASQPSGKGSMADAKPAAPTVTKKDGAKSAASQPATRAASLLQIGQNLEKSGKTDAALSSYRRIVAAYPGTPAAQTAAQRIRALGKR